MDAVCESESCGSRSFRTGDDGYTYCSEGHRQSQTGLITADEDDGLPSTGQKSRKRIETEEVETGLTEKEAIEHYLLCLQVILRKQVGWLISNKDAPKELESVVKDLWALRLQTLQARIDRGKDDDTRSQLYSSQSEGDTSDDHPNSKRSNKLIHSLPTINEALTMCCVGLWIVQTPLMAADLYRWVSAGELIYYGAIRCLDMKMRRRLPARLHFLIEPRHQLNPEILHSRMSNAIAMYHKTFGLTVPPLNHRLYLYRLAREMSLPIEVYVVTKRLSSVLDITFGHDHENESSSRSVALRSPEGRAVSLLIVATKLLFPFDGLQRYPEHSSELAAMQMDWDAWGRTRDSPASTEKAGDLSDYKAMLNVTEKDVLRMSNDELERYMTWYEGAFTTEDTHHSGRGRSQTGYWKSLFRLFPLSHSTLDNTRSSAIAAVTQDEALAQGLRSSQAALKPVSVVNEDTAGHTYDPDVVVRPGSHYKRYRKITDMDEPAKRFFQEVAELVGFSMETLVRGVLAIEKKLEKWEHRI